jgi:hypothetical protein
MKKLSLALGELKVESFETFAAEKAAGTVHANGAFATFSCGGTCGIDPRIDVAGDRGAAVSLPPVNCCA